MLREQTRYSRLANITKLINSKLELREVLEQVTTAISEEIVQCDAVGIYLPQEDGTYRGYVGKPKSLNGVTLDTLVIDPKIDLLAREVIETKKTIYIPDTLKDNRPDPVPVNAFKIKSILALPISFEQELFGLVFLFDYGTPMRLIKSEIQSVEAYVNMAAVAIRNAKFLNQKESLILEKQLLLDVTRDLSLCSTIQESLDKCYFYLGKVLNNDHICAQLLDSSIEGSIKMNNCDMDLLEIWGNLKKDPCFDSMIQRVIETKKSILIQDVFSDERLNHDVCREYAVEGLFMIPLVSIGKVLGIVAILDFVEKGHIYTVSQVQLAQSIVDTTASTLSSMLNRHQLESLIEERTMQLEMAIEKKNDVIESISDGFISLNKDWIITYMNKHYFTKLKKTPEELLGKNAWDVFSNSFHTIIFKEFHKVMSERIHVHFEAYSSYTDCWYEIVAYPYGDGIGALFKDITEKKKFEKEFKRLSGLELIGQMTAGISHEIRNPLTTVRGFLQVLKEKKELKKFKQYLNLMIEELDRATSIITEFLSMSNTTSSDLKELDLNLIIHDMAPLIEIDAYNQKKYIKFELQTIPKLRLNRNEIRQLVINLYRNGLEAMGEGKVLTIQTYKEKDRVVLAFKDQGDEMKSEVLEKLGTPFFTTKEKGTGLGLGVCYAIAARHHAKIEVQTGKEGSIFSVRFRLN